MMNMREVMEIVMEVMKIEVMKQLDLNDCCQPI